MPKWFGISAGVAGAVAEVADTVAEETPYPAGTPPSIEQEQPGVYQPAPATTPAPTPQQTQLSAQHCIAYDKAYNTWVKVVPQGRGRYFETVDPYATLGFLRRGSRQRGSGKSGCTIL